MPLHCFAGQIPLRSLAKAQDGALPNFCAQTFISDALVQSRRSRLCITFKTFSRLPICCYTLEGRPLYVDFGKLPELNGSRSLARI